MDLIKTVVPIEIQEIVQTLSKKYEVYFVGGCVRDFLLKKKIHDYDCTTSATVDEMKEELKNYKIIETGIKHGTLTIMNNYHTVEITTYRIDKEYIHHRFPSSVEFTRNIEEDLKRRDFTINAIACDLEGNIIDYHHGLSDLKNGIIRCVGNPTIRFNEDALRILRAIRFSCTLDFEIENYTKNAIYESMHLLNQISIERKRDELFKILCTDKPYNILKEYNLLNLFKLSYHPCIKEIDQSRNDLEIRLANLFNSSKIAKKYLLEWHCSKKMIEHVSILVENKHINKFDAYQIRKFIYKFGIEMTNKILLINHLDITLFNKIVNNKDYLIKLDINGQDLLELGYKGKEIKDILNTCTEIVFHNMSYNNKNYLINYIKKNIH